MNVLIVVILIFSVMEDQDVKYRFYVSVIVLI